MAPPSNAEVERATNAPRFASMEFETTPKAVRKMLRRLSSQLSATSSSLSALLASPSSSVPSSKKSVDDLPDADAARALKSPVLSLRDQFSSNVAGGASTSTVGGGSRVRSDSASTVVKLELDSLMKPSSPVPPLPPSTTSSKSLPRQGSGGALLDRAATVVRSRHNLATTSGASSPLTKSGSHLLIDADDTDNEARKSDYIDARTSRGSIDSNIVSPVDGSSESIQGSENSLFQTRLVDRQRHPVVKNGSNNTININNTSNSGDVVSPKSKGSSSAVASIARLFDDKANNNKSAKPPTVSTSTEAIGGAIRSQYKERPAPISTSTESVGHAIRKTYNTSNQSSPVSPNVFASAESVGHAIQNLFDEDTHHKQSESGGD